MRRLIFTILTLLCCDASAVAPSFTENFASYYASIKSSEVNVRKGPNARYPIEWVFKKKGEPVEVIAQFEHWYKIKDFSGDEGWVKSTMLTKKRRGVINVKINNDSPSLYALLYDKADVSSQVIAKISHSKRVDITKCNKNWCQIKIVNLSGWIEKFQLWGVYAKEEFK